ncbi:E3 ubiquitin-protein ligase HECTD1 [Echinococcus granulosus]|nr:E3 ubiquitin-protein ligase HECTD1 [Echinococcus granulosus]
MEVDVPSLISWLQSGDKELQQTSLEYLCNVLLFANDRSFVDKLDTTEVISALLHLFSEDNAPDDVLELNARTLLYLLEMLDVSTLQNIRVKHYKILCTRLDIADFSSSSGSELAQRIIKLLDFITSMTSEKAYLGGVLSSVLRFVRWHSEEVHADVVQSSMNIIHELCRRCEPSDGNMQEWMESLTDLLSHSNYEVVVKMALQSLGCIFERFSSSGQDLSPIATNELITRLSHHLYKACGIFPDIRAPGLSLFYYPSFLAFVMSYSSEHGDTSLDEDDPEAFALEGKPDLILANSLTNILLTLFCCSADATRYLLSRENYLAFSLISLLRNCRDEGMLTSVFRLLQVIILKLGHKNPTTLPDVQSAPGDGVSLEEANNAEKEDSIYTLTSFCSFRAAMEAIKSGNMELVKRLLSDGLDLRYVDNHGQSLLDWAVVCGTPEVVETICSQPEAGLTFDLACALGYAAAFGREKVCRILLRHGADPNATGEDGLRPLDRVKAVKPLGGREVIKLLEEYVSMGKEGASISLHRSNLQLLPIYRIDVFAQTQSESVKYQTVLILLQIVSRLSSQSLEIINTYPFEISLSFRLSQMIFMALSEEAVKTVHCAFQLCYQLLTKARSIYLPLMHRAGIIPLVKSIDSVMQLPHFRFIGKSDDCSYYYPVRETLNEVGGGDSVHSSNSIVDFIPNESRGDNDGTASEFSETADIAAGESQRQTEEEQQNEAPAVMHTPGYPGVDEPDPKNPSPSVTLTESENDSEDEPYPLSSAYTEEWQGWYIIIFGNFLFIYNDSAVVLFDINREDNTLCGLYLTSSKNNFPIEFRGEMELIDKSIGSLRHQILYLTRHFINSRNFYLANERVQHWPRFYLDDPTLERKRPRSMSRRRLDSQPGHRQRASSTPPRRNLQVFGKEFEEYTIIRTDHWKTSKESNVVGAGNLLLDIVQTESGLPLLRVRPKGVSDDAFVFSARPHQGFFKLRPCPDLAFIIHKIINPLSEAKGSAPIIISMDGRFWVVNSSSGRILKDLFTESSQEKSTAPVEEEQLIRFKMHYLASRILSHDLVPTTSPDSEKPLPSAPPERITARAQNLNGSISGTNTINALSEIAAALASAPYQTSKQEAMVDLNGCFTRLAAIFSTGEEAVTPYELSSSGLIPSLLLCLSSSSCVRWGGVVNSNDSHYHIEFLLQRRQTFLRIFEGNVGLPILIRCLLNVLDQTERLPIHLFEEISYPTSSDQLKHEVSACMEALTSASPSTLATIEVPPAKAPRSCPPNSSSCFDFTGYCRSTEEYSQVLPLGLIAPPLPSTSDFHNHLTGGGVRGLVDRQVLLLLGAWFPGLHTRLCTGSVGTPQVQDSFTMIVKRRHGATREIRVGSGKGRPLFLSHGFPRGRSCFMSASTEHFLRGVTLVKEWHECSRKSMPFLREFWKKPRHAISLTPEALPSTFQTSSAVELHMGLFEWMGTYGGTVETWVNPCQCGLATALVFHPSTPDVICDGSLSVEHSATISNGSQIEEEVVTEEEGMNNLDSRILNGEEVGARLTIEIGLQLVPTAYRLNTLRNKETGLPIRNWCLQASNNGKHWTTLSVHRDTVPLNGTPVTIPLSQRNFRLWSGPLSGSTNTTTLTRHLSTGALNEAFATLDVASVSTPESGAGQSEVVLSFRIFRIMDLTAIPKQSNLIVKGFELFGTVNFVHPSLLTQEKLAGFPVHFRNPKKISNRSSVAASNPDSSKASAAAQSANPTSSSSDVGQNTRFQAVEDIYGHFAPPTSAQTAETSHPSVERRAFEFAEAIDALIASNILHDMNESLAPPENQPPPKKLCTRESPRSCIINDVHTEAPESESLFLTRGSSDQIGKSIGRTTVHGVIEAQSEHKLENKEAELDEAVELAFSPPRNGLGITNVSASSSSLTTAKLHMLKQMSALREGRQLNQLDLQSCAAMFPLVPGLIPSFDPSAPQARPSSSSFHLRISPDCMFSPEFFYQKEKEYDLRMELFARRKDDSVVASVHIDDLNAPIFKYILKLAEEVLYSQMDRETTADGLPIVQISLEYSFCNPSEESEYDEPTSQSTSLLTSRDVRLIGAQENQLERLGIHSPGRIKRSTKERTEELLDLLQLLAKLTGVIDVADVGTSSTRFSTASSDPLVSARDFISFSLTRKLKRQLQDVLAVATGPTLPDWCMNLTQRVTALFPYSIRHHFFRACAFGPARSLLWLQSNVAPSLSINEDFYDQRRLVSYLQRTAATRFAANISSHLNHTDCDLGAVESSDELVMDVDSFAHSRGRCDCHLQTIGRLFRNFIDIPRDESVDLSGCGFWAWAERVMDEHAESKSELEIRFTNEEGTGLGPTLEFFSLLALEFRRKSLGMWLTDSFEQVEPLTESNSSSSYINPSFGLFPTPYPRNIVPLNVLRRFYIMGIAVAKALQDNHLMDLPLSRPFLKFLACYGSSRQTRCSAGVEALEAELNLVSDAEASRERILLSEDPLFIGRQGTITGSSRHWLTGLLDFEDFASIQPERANFFRQLLRLRTIHKAIREVHLLKGDFCLERRLDEASVEMLGCTVQDLCISMEFVPQSTLGTENLKMKLLDVYPWESPSTSIKDEPAEPISNKNFTVYIRRTLEYCLDKGIRAQMDAFKAGLERVFSMNWLSVFTSTEVGHLISGASGVSWTREELLAYTSPILGYTKSSPAFLLLIDVLVAFDTGERRKFLRFISGSSSLPVGGLKNLNPRLRIVCKDRREGPYPSVNTCAHYLKLPEYSSAEELRHYLTTAMEQTGFYLN